eukprot:TRINITY_DN11375_c0_g1_i2.p1 TRINITY_DN11375_c0_g1~~TRINITY_DN11375_c0_g1_i2.p1  ORF type:complete len:1217 (-),score=250.11 TRINITY_DN11375_c0_g1_i2:118-3666(-)
MALKKGKKRPRDQAAVATKAEEEAHEAVDGEESAQQATKAPRRDSAKADDTVKAPDADEVLEIAKTHNLYKSNLFRLQLEELLKETSPRSAHPKLETFLRGLQPILRNLVSRQIPADFRSEFPSLLFHQHQQDPHPFSFQAPARVDLVGSFLLGTCMRSHSCVDVALEIPSETLASKDYLNFRYADKRSAYVGEIYKQLVDLQAARVKGKKGETAEFLEGVSLQFATVDGDAYRPCVVLRPGPSRTEGGAWSVRLLPCYAADLWPAQRLGPDRNALRPRIKAVETPPTGAAEMPPTPYYNTNVLQDGRMRSNLELLHKAAQKLSALKDSIILLKRWAVARGFIPRSSCSGNVSSCAAVVGGSLNGFCLAMLAAHAGQTANVAPSQTSSFQLFKLALNVLSTTDWATQKVVFGKATVATLTEEEVAAGGGAHFYDADGLLNFFARLGPSIGEVRWEAQRALKLLDAKADPYDAVFGHTSSPELIWDLVVRSAPLDASALSPSLFSDVVADGGVRGAATASVASVAAGCGGGRRPADEPEALLLAANLATVLAAGLGNRCTRVGVRVIGDPSLTWCAGSRGGDATARPPQVVPVVFVGIALEATTLDRPLDRGPAAQESAEAAQFRSLWGAEKAELRRFKDGSILECAVWEKPPPGRQVESRKHPAVVTQIVRHLLAKHFPHIASSADVITGPVGLVPNMGDQDRRLWHAFEGFRTHLCQLSSLPITIKDVHPASSAFGYSEVDSPPAPMGSDGVERTLHDVVVEFESSGRWPSSQEAVRKVCTAMMLQMQEELKTDLDIESGITEEFLDVRYPEFVFRTRVFHQHELTAAAFRVANFQAPLNSPLPDVEAMERLATLWWRPRICSCLRGHVLQLPALAGAIRLLKRWMASQMLSGFEDFAEHLAIAVFLHPAPFETPTSPHVGFSRACWLLSSFDWQREPLMIDLDARMTDEERLAIRSSFEASRGLGKAGGAVAESQGVFWVASRFDPHSLLLKTPPATVCAWLQRRAGQALNSYNRRLLGTSRGPVSSGWQELFALDETVFDVVVRLAAPGASGSEAAGGGPAAKKAAMAKRRAAATGEAVLAFIAKLRANFSSVCLVFHDAGNHVVALKWRPSAFMPQPQNVLMGSVPHSIIARPALADGERATVPLAVPNVLCLTSMVAALAEGLALSITIPGDGGGSL